MNKVVFQILWSIIWLFLWGVSDIFPASCLFWQISQPDENWWGTPFLEEQLVGCSSFMPDIINYLHYLLSNNHNKTCIVLFSYVWGIGLKKVWFIRVKFWNILSKDISVICYFGVIPPFKGMFTVPIVYQLIEVPDWFMWCPVHLSNIPPTCMYRNLSLERVNTVKPIQRIIALIYQNYYNTSSIC